MTLPTVQTPLANTPPSNVNVTVSEPKTISDNVQAGDQKTGSVDLMSRVTSFIQKNDPSKVNPDPNTDTAFDFKAVENIKDPQAKEWAINAYKSMQKGFNQKFEEMANLRKSLEASKPIQKTTWTAERIKNELLNDPNFVQEAARLSGVNEDNANMSDEEKRVARLEQELEDMKSQTQQSAWRQNKALEDEQLRKRYANYDPNTVSKIEGDLISGNVIATREHLYKAFYHDDNVNNAYKLGYEDALKEKQENNVYTAPTGSNITPNSGGPVRDPKESSSAFFERVALTNLAKRKSGQLK